MKNKFLALATAGLTFIGVQAASADCCFNMDSWYTELAAGGSWHRDSSLGDGANVEEDTGFEINFSIGYKCECWRLALQAHYERFNNNDYEYSNYPCVSDDGYLSTFALMFNLFYDIPINDCLVWYLGAGIGAGVHRLGLENSIAGTTSKEDTKFAWQLMTGFVYDLNPCWAVTLNYAWLSLLKPDGPIGRGLPSQKLHKAPFSNNVDLGLRLKF